MCTYTQSDHALTHWKCVLRCCAEFKCINLPDQEKDNHYSETTPSIRFQIYHIIVSCSAHGRIPMKDKEKCVRKNLHHTNLQKYTSEKN